MISSFLRLRGRASAAALLLALAALLAACGSSSSGGSGSPSAASTTASATGPAGRPGFARLRACLQQQGVTLPRPRAGAPGRARPNGGGPGFGFGFRRAGGFFARLSSAERARLRAAMQKCGAPLVGFRRFGRFRGPDFRSPAFRRALAAYVACVRSNGFDLPAPNTSGKGPIFDPGRIDRRDPRFQAASAKCQHLLAAARPAPPPGGPPPPGQGG
ncbi:MAG TPA: hypothetical protein VN635_05085 [Conexibacter sp.]|nr:hypothetical protein [Conexibacter sp.]